MNPLISVIIPAFNTADYIGKAITSALDQTLTNLEVIVVDDASTDNTLQVINSFKDERIKVLVNAQNLGAGASRNRALQAAKGEWIAVLDSDDWYAPERLENLLKIAEANQADMVADDLHLIRDGENSPWSTLIRESGESITTIKKIDPVYYVETDIYGQKSLHLGITKPLFKRSFLTKNNLAYNPNFRICQDYWLTLNCLVMGANFFLKPTAYYYYRSRQGSNVYSSKISTLEQNTQAIIDFIKDFQGLVDPLLIDALSRNLWVLEKNLAYYRVVEPLKTKNFDQALQQMLCYPYFFLHFFQKLPGIIDRKIQQYLFENEAANDLFYRRKSKIFKINDFLKSKRN